MLEEKGGLVSSSEIIAVILMDKVWVYRRIRELVSMGLLFIDIVKNPWVPNNIELTGYGKMTLRRIKRIYKRIE